MRDFFVVVIILGVILYGSHYINNHYNEVYNYFNDELEILSKNIDIDDEKERTIKKIENKWIEYEKILITFEEHEMIDKVEEDLYDCFYYYKTNNKEEFERSSSQLSNKIEDLIKREKLTLVNLF